MEEDDIRSYSLEEIKAMIADGNYSKTRPDAPEYPLPEGFWEKAKLVMPEQKRSVRLQMDQEVFDWFKAQGKGHITRMQAVLRSYYEAHQSST